MKIGMIGLGRMGGNMARRLLSRGHAVVGYARNPRALAAIEEIGGTGAASAAQLVEQLDAPRHVWLMVPAGKPVDDLLEELVDLLEKGDVVVDGGNSFYKDTVRRAHLSLIHISEPTRPY